MKPANKDAKNWGKCHHALTNSGVAILIALIMSVSQLYGWHLIAPEGQLRYQRNPQSENNFKVIDELNRFISNELTLDDLTKWFGAPVQIKGGTIKAENGYLFARYLYRGPQTGNGPPVEYEQYVFNAREGMKLYYLRSMEQGVNKWFSEGYVAVKWDQNSLGSFSDVSTAQRDAWDKANSEVLLSLLRKKKAEHSGTGQPATPSESKFEGNDIPQPESVIADELRDALIPSAENLHVIETGPKRDGDPFDADPRQLRVAPLYSYEIASLGKGRIFDLGAFTRQCGVDINPDELVIYCPQTRLVFCRGRSHTIDMVRQLFESPNHGIMSYRFTVWAEIDEPEKQEAAKRRVVMRGDSVSGARFEVALHEGRNFSLEFVANPEEKKIDATVSGTVQVGDSEVKISTRCVSVEGKEILLFERPTKGDPKGVDRLILQIDAMPNEEQKRHNEDWQREQSIKIAQELLNLKKSNKPAQTDSDKPSD